MSSKLEIKLPPALIGRAHLAQLVRELEVVENDFESQKARGATKDTYKMPHMTRALSDCIELNKIDIMSGQVRMHFKSALNDMKNKAPVIHFTFASEPDLEVLQKLTDWVRTEVHPQALVSVGIQPGLVGGVYLRTPNHVHDFSLKALLHTKRGIIADELATAIQSAQTAPPSTRPKPEPSGIPLTAAIANPGVKPS